MKKLGFGLMRLPLLDKDDYSSVDIERFKNMADTFLANGFTYFDTAYPYHRGNSEVAFREAVVKRYPRSAYTITDKLSLFMIRDEKEIPGFFEKQLQQLGVDYVDYYWLHGLNGRTYQQAEEIDHVACNVAGAVTDLVIPLQITSFSVFRHENFSILLCRGYAFSGIRWILKSNEASSRRYCSARRGPQLAEPMPFCA